MKYLSDPVDRLRSKSFRQQQLGGNGNGDKSPVNFEWHGGSQAVSADVSLLSSSSGLWAVSVPCSLSSLKRSTLGMKMPDQQR